MSLEDLQSIKKIRNGCACASLILFLVASFYITYSAFVPADIQKIFDYRTINPESKNNLMGYICMGFGLFMLIPAGVYALHAFILERKYRKTRSL